LCLSPEKEAKKIIIFGSFLSSNEPNDLDIAIVQDSKEPYLALAMKYRKKMRAIAKRIPIDVIPLKDDVNDDPFFDEIKDGEVIYEK